MWMHIHKSEILLRQLPQLPQLIVGSLL